MVFSSSCDKPETLNELTQLRDCEFGQPHPRHGLRLLHWLAHDRFIYDHYYHSATLRCEPRRGDYGFHYFQNRENDLPSVRDGYNYYIVGNLNEPKAQHLPSYVWENNSGYQDDSNRDRIILSMGPGNVIDKIYATEHQGKGRFNNKRTYCISKGLMMIIKELELQTFLHQMKNNRLSLQAPEVRAASASMPPTVIDTKSSSPSRGFWEDYCIIL
ncbi:hypothetical protein COCON_G00236220 [Conger conger]|uniref:Uncharacterized protein n=1 Tax=Conger conger TaxID=82655 RepID=A0A9Q1CU85_CONCO|nr:uncharacterized protein LOC133131439 [Conger conger]KAJ8245046.1 hypothetical protein COCON_G00236220 [Conger conger]